MADARFWMMIDALRESASPYTIHPASARSVFERFSEEERGVFQAEILKVLKEGERWDLWAVGAILHGKLGLRFCREFVLWVVLQGKRFCGRVFRDPCAAAERVSPEDPGSEFDVNGIAPFAGDVAAGRPRGEGGPFWSSSLTGKPWTWLELSGRHPDLWERYFVKRDRRPPVPKGGDDSHWICEAVAPLNDWGDIYGDPAYLLAQYEVLNPGQIGLPAVCWWRMEYDNGGMDQFFRNSTGVVARETLMGLERFGAGKYARLMKKALEAFGEDGPPRERTERQVLMSRLWPQQDIDSVLQLPEPDEDWEGLVASHIRKHPSAFFRT